MLARNFWPNSAKNVVRPRREFPVKLFIKRPEEAENFDDVRSGLSVEVHGVELVNDVVYQRL